MKEHPIIFSAPLVLALLAGTKTQTRRIIKPQPDEYAYLLPDGRCKLVHDSGEATHVSDIIRCPFGVPGDRLWVRETCRAEELPDGTNGVRYLADNHFQPIDDTAEAAEAWGKLYHYGKRRGATVPPIHAPRWTSRLLLEKVAGRVEQLQSITEADAQAEGVEVLETLSGLPYYRHYLDAKDWVHLAKDSFRTLWYSIHGPSSWEANPWVWVEQFKRIQL